MSVAFSALVSIALVSVETVRFARAEDVLTQHPSLVHAATLKEAKVLSSKYYGVLSAKHAVFIGRLPAPAEAYSRFCSAPFGAAI